MNTFAQQLADDGVELDCADKMPVKTGKPPVTLASATAQILENLKANKAHWVDGAKALDVKKLNYKEVDGVYAIGVKYTIRYLKDVFGPGKTVAKYSDNKKFVAMFDKLIVAVESGMLDEQIRAGIAANANMRKS